LRSISALLILVVECGANSVADKRPKTRTNKRTGNMTACAISKLRTDDGTPKSAYESPGIFFRTRPEPVGISGTGSQHETDYRRREIFRPGHSAPEPTRRRFRINLRKLKKRKIRQKSGRSVAIY
jgi:hypothetical protein